MPRGSIRKGGNLATEKAARDGGDSGDPIEPGKPQESLLWDDRVGAMPKGRPKMSAAEKSHRVLITADATWGTPEIDPFVDDRSPRRSLLVVVEPIQRPALPAVKAAVVAEERHRSIRARELESKGLKNSAEADRRTLIRRLSFDLIGLPPEPDDVEKFVADESTEPTKARRPASRFAPLRRAMGPPLARRGRFAETRATSATIPRTPGVSRWVIESLNRDRLYDEFMRLQIAGDVLNPKDLDSLIATGYGVVGPGTGGAQRRVGGDEEGDPVDGWRTSSAGPGKRSSAFRSSARPRPQVRPDHAEGVLPGRRPLRRHPSGGKGAGEHRADRDRTGEIFRRRGRSDPPATAHLAYWIAAITASLSGS